MFLAARTAEINILPFPSTRSLKKSHCAVDGCIWWDEGKNFVISSSTVVCGKHFEEDCVFPSVGSDEGKETTAKRSYCRLKPGSVPTLFWFRPSPMHRSSPAEQKATSDERAKQLKMQKNLLVYGPPTNVTCLCEKLAASERRSEELERALEDSKKECKTLRSQ